MLCSFLNKNIPEIEHSIDRLTANLDAKMEAHFSQVLNIWFLLIWYWNKVLTLKYLLYSWGWLIIIWHNEFPNNNSAKTTKTKWVRFSWLISPGISIAPNVHWTWHCAGKKLIRIFPVSSSITRPMWFLSSKG